MSHHTPSAANQASERTSLPYRDFSLRLQPDAAGKPTATDFFALRRELSLVRTDTPAHGQIFTNNTIDVIEPGASYTTINMNHLG